MTAEKSFKKKKGKPLEPTKKDTLHPKQKRSHNKMLGRAQW